MRRFAFVIGLGILLGACARTPEPREAVAYPGAPVQAVIGTSYAASAGLRAPPANAEGVVPPPPPRFLGSSVSASSSNVSAHNPDLRRDALGRGSGAL